MSVEAATAQLPRLHCGDEVLLNVVGFFRDGARWKDAHKFMPDRFDERSPVCVDLRRRPFAQVGPAKWDLLSGSAKWDLRRRPFAQVGPAKWDL